MLFQGGDTARSCCGIEFLPGKSLVDIDNLLDQCEITIKRLRDLVDEIASEFSDSRILYVT